MPTQEVFRNDWVEFFHGFSQAHHGWLATIEVFGSELGAQVEVLSLPLEGITPDLRESGPDSIALTVGTTPDSHLTHTVTLPKRVRLDQTEEGERESLQIESADNTTILVRLQPPAFPDLIPGVILE